MENTKDPIKVGGQDVTGHTAKPIDPNNPPKRDAKTGAAAVAPASAPLKKAGNN